MLTYDEALARILSSIIPLADHENVPLADASGRVLAESIVAAADIPAFANSAVDGFAVHREDIATAMPDSPVTLPVTRTIAAGSTPSDTLPVGEVARILTGAPVPPGADSIVMLEDTRPAVGSTPTNEFVEVLDPGSDGYIRRAGGDVRRGTEVLSPGLAIDAGVIGLLAALNRDPVPCVRKPRVGLIVTGNEIVPTGAAEIPPGKIRDANGPALAAAIREGGGGVTVTATAGDSLESTRAALLQCARTCDIIVSTGGVSVGQYDYVKAAVESLGTLDFWRIAIRPGKPLAFGHIEGALFFGLPGNPVSSLVTFELFVRPALRKLAGFTEVHRSRVSATLTEDLPHESGRREFVRTRLEWVGEGFAATPTGSQGSHRLSSLVGANAYLIADEAHGDYPAGAVLPAILLGGA